MRIAVCISGQLRNWSMGYHNQKWFWSAPNIPNCEVDYFAHTWTYSWDREGVSLPYKKRDVSKEEFDEFLKAFDIKKSILDDKPQEYFYGNDHWSGLFYSFSQSLRLKQEYELENNFKYDVVVKTRPDVVFNPKRTFHIPRLDDGVIFTTHGGIMEMEFNMYNISDIVFLGNSYTMDLLINLYAYRQYMLHKADKNIYNVHPLGPGTLMHEYMRDYGITPIFGMGFFETLLKEGCPENLDLFNEEDFAKMEKYFQEWYTK